MNQNIEVTAHRKLSSNFKMQSVPPNKKSRSTFAERDFLLELILIA
jgi:hypothetical protein